MTNPEYVPPVFLTIQVSPAVIRPSHSLIVRKGEPEDPVFESDAPTSVSST